MLFRSLLTRPTLVRRDAPCPKQGRSSVADPCFTVPGGEARTPLADFFSILLGREFSEPKGVEVLVKTFTVYQFGMGTGFHEAPFVEDENAIRSLDGR